MVIHVFPVAKLATLLLRQISKPIANIVKEEAKSSPVFRKYVCMPPAQFYNWCEVKTKMWILNLGKPVNIPVLNEAMAIELGANLLGEAIIFFIAAFILINEYNRSTRKEAAKEEAKRQEMQDIRNTLAELFIQSEQHAAHIRELMRRIEDLDTRISASTAPKGDNNEPTTPQSPPPKIPAEELPLTEEDLAQSTVRSPNPTLYSKTVRSPVQTSLVLRAVSDVERQFWDYPLIERQSSIVILGLFHINKLFRFQQ